MAVLARHHPQGEEAEDNQVEQGGRAQPQHQSDEMQHAQPDFDGKDDFRR